MLKLAFVVLLALSGCSHFKVNGSMCDQMVNEPAHTIPKECQNYEESEAQKAFDKVVNEKKVSDKDITFEKDE